MVVKIKDKNLYYVGGVVRDEILGLQSFDVDLCYEGDAITFAKNNFYKIIKENSDFGTVRILISNEEVDLASTRTESYPQKGHLPQVSCIGCSLKDDLARRDFTINSLAKNTISGEILDYYGGIEDLKNRKIKVLHDKSFIDDPTRIVRALKFSVRFNFELDNNTKMLQDEYLRNINYDLSFHRLKKELKETFNLNVQVAYDKFVEQGIYRLLGVRQVVPELKASIEKVVSIYKPVHTWLVYLGAFDLSNFELTKTEYEIIDSFKKISSQNPINDLDIYKMFEGLPLESILLYALFVNPEVAFNYLDDLSKVKIEVTGVDLIAMGIQQGVIYKEIFDFLTEQKILGVLKNKEEEINAVRKKFLC